MFSLFLVRERGPRAAKSLCRGGPRTRRPAASNMPPAFLVPPAVGLQAPPSPERVVAGSLGDKSVFLNPNKALGAPRERRGSVIGWLRTAAIWAQRSGEPLENRDGELLSGNSI